MNEKLSAVIDFDYICNGLILSKKEGSASGYLYLESQCLRNSKFNCLFASDKLNDDLITKTSNRLLKANRFPAFNVISDSDNDKYCVDRKFTLQGISQVMQMDIREQGDRGLSIGDSFDLIRSTLPHSSQYLELMDECFFRKDDERKEWLKVFAKLEQNHDLDERTFMLSDRNRPVAISQTSSDFEEQKSFLYNVGTSDNYRRKGISSKLLNLVIQETHSAGSNVMYLTTSNPSAIEMYKKCGFSIKGSTKLYVDHTKN